MGGVVGEKVGSIVGVDVGRSVGRIVGFDVGDKVGRAVVGDNVGRFVVGALVGNLLVVGVALGHVLEQGKEMIARHGENRHTCDI